MPATITLKNIRDERRLQPKRSAALDRRSLNSEVLVRLASPEHPLPRPSVDETIERLQALHATMTGGLLHEGEIDAMKREGRP